MSARAGTSALARIAGRGVLLQPPNLDSRYSPIGQCVSGTRGSRDCPKVGSHPQRILKLRFGAAFYVKSRTLTECIQN